MTAEAAYADKPVPTTARAAEAKRSYQNAALDAEIKARVQAKRAAREGLRAGRREGRTDAGRSRGETRSKMRGSAAHREGGPQPSRLAETETGREFAAGRIPAYEASETDGHGDHGRQCRGRLLRSRARPRASSRAATATRSFSWTRTASPTRARCDR